MRRCQKPSKTEFLKISQAVGVGFIVMGAIGFVIKLSQCILPTYVVEYEGSNHVISVHIPVNNVLVS
jgi:protein transport protein SEC61 subunit gamma-like protein